MKKAAIGIVGIMTILIVGFNSTLLWAQPSMAEKEREVINFLKEVNPRAAENVEKLRAINPAAYSKLLEEMKAKYEELKKVEVTRPDLAKRTIEVMKLEGQVEDLAHQYKQAKNTEEKGRLREEIKRLLAKALEEKIELEQVRVNEIEKQLKILKERVAQRKKDKDKIIEKRLLNITAKDYLEW